MTFTLLNTRPINQAQALANMVTEEGGISLSCPTLEIEFLTDAGSSLIAQTDFDVIIFTSVNAIKGFLQQTAFVGEKSVLERTIAGVKIYAIGQATAEYGQQAGLSIETLSAQKFDSENLLAHAAIQQVNGLNMLLVKGEGGRKLIAQTLLERGARVATLEVYKRVPAVFCQNEWGQFLKSPQPNLLLTSLDSWQSLKQHLQNYYAEILNTDLSQNKPFFSAHFWQQITQVVVMSERIKAALQQQGCTVPIKVVATQSNAGIIAAISKTE